MNNFYVIANQQKEPARKEAAFIRDYLQEHGKKCYIQEEPGDQPLQAGVSSEPGPSPESGDFYSGYYRSSEGGGRFKYTDASRIPPDVEGVLVLGGDGTLLQASRDLIDTGLPLLGINMGTLGYLAEIDIPNVQSALDRLMTDDYTIEDRMMISGTAYHHNRRLMTDIALNDIVIDRRGRMRVVDFNVFVDDVFLCSYRADGLIISTPTGSTGYSLSAGGPIVSPDASLMLLTAVAPHTLTSRTIVLPDNVAVTVEIDTGTAYSVESGAEVTYDGDTSARLDFGSRVCVTKTEKKTHFIKINHTSFVEIIREKLK